jgi:glyoxylase-like metal-dependent hydrolase (beta-lactamase superfamily II)
MNLVSEKNTVDQEMPAHSAHPGSQADNRAPIKSISVISTGSGEVHPEHIFGTRKPTLWWIFTSKRWVTIPIYVFVIEHTQGLVLFDTGMDRAVITNSDYFPDKVTAFFMRHIFRFHLGPEDTLTIQLEQAGYRSSDVQKAVVSHLHFDHAGGIREIPQAELIVSQEAWEHMMGPHPEREGVLRRDIDISDANWHKIALKPTDDESLAPFTEAFDLMGDGSMILLPTPGHLTGSLSMLVMRKDLPPVLLIGDLAYRVSALERGQLPGTGDKKQLWASYKKVLELKEHIPELVILSSHDQEATYLFQRN